MEESTVRINPEEVAKAALLAKLSLSPDEEKQYTQEFDDILEHFAVIDGFDLTGVEAFDLTSTPPAPLRKDEPVLFEDQKKLHRNVKTMMDGLIQVPKILE
jgi:aspartyl-tRNA(Asn)/glutamyl-tRNA(Gln) amidotransferase subunit C